MMKKLMKLRHSCKNPNTKKRVAVYLLVFLTCFIGLLSIHSTMSHTRERAIYVQQPLKQVTRSSLRQTPKLHFPIAMTLYQWAQHYRTHVHMLTTEVATARHVIDQIQEQTVALLPEDIAQEKTLVHLGEMNTSYPYRQLVAGMDKEVQLATTHTLSLSYELARSAPTRTVMLFTIPSQYFVETGHNLNGLFKTFFDTHGGITTLGLPITESFIDNGVHVQYFERARLEIAPANSDHVQMTPLGDLLTYDLQETKPFQPRSFPSEQASSQVWAVAPDVPPDIRSSVFFTETGHTLQPEAYAFWKSHGGRDVFGLPISEMIPTFEQSLGRVVINQYFEKARFEYHSEKPNQPYTIHLGLIGREYAAAKRVATELLQPARPVVRLSKSVFHFPPSSVALINVGTAANKFDRKVVQPGETISFLESVGALNSEAGYAWGSAVVNGTVEDMIAGGICYLSTALFQAALDAGVDIVERHQHSLLLSDFSSAPGLDSAVFRYDDSGMVQHSGDLDLVWRNDTDGPIIMELEVTPQGRLSVAFWGYADGRQTIIHEPEIQHVAEPEEPLWVEDDSLAPCEIKQVSKEFMGMSVLVDRVVTAEDGSLLHSDRFYSYYAPSRDIFMHGTGVTTTLNVDIQQARQMCLEAPAATYHAAEQEVSGDDGQSDISDTPSEEEQTQPSQEQPVTQLFTMPALYGLSQDEAFATLTNMGVAAEQIYIDYQSAAQVGLEPNGCQPLTVLSTIPTAAQQFEPLTPIILGVCEEQQEQ